MTMLLNTGMKIFEMVIQCMKFRNTTELTTVYSLTFTNCVLTEAT